MEFFKIGLKEKTEEEKFWEIAVKNSNWG